jgi:mRNA interferase RelE/StbE
MRRSKSRLRVPDEVADLIRGMHPHLKKKVRASLKLIMADPGEGKSLRGELFGLRSFRVGRFRIVYSVKKDIIEIVAVGPRERIYEETYLLLKRGQK